MCNLVFACTIIFCPCNCVYLIFFGIIKLFIECVGSIVAIEFSLLIESVRTSICCYNRVILRAYVLPVQLYLIKSYFLV